MRRYAGALARVVIVLAMVEGAVDICRSSGGMRADGSGSRTNGFSQGSGSGTHRQPFYQIRSVHHGGRGWDAAALPTFFPSASESMSMPCIHAVRQTEDEDGWRTRALSNNLTRDHPVVDRSSLSCMTPTCFRSVHDDFVPSSSSSAPSTISIDTTTPAGSSSTASLMARHIAGFNSTNWILENRPPPFFRNDITDLVERIFPRLLHEKHGVPAGSLKLSAR